MMKKMIGIFGIVALLTGSLTACGKNSEGKDGGVIATDGSTSMEKVIGILGEAYTEENNGVKFTYNPTGSGTGITAVAEGRTDIGLSSRVLKEEEKEKGLEETILALDGIAVIVNKENPVTDLSLKQVAGIYKGEITNWKEIGGSDMAIVVIGREAGSGTRDGFESVTKVKEKAKYRQELTSTGDVITTTESNPGAIGYASIASLKESVQAVKINGVQPTEEAVKDGSYLIQRPFVLVTRKGMELTKPAKDFFDFITSEKASELIKKAGVVPLK